MRFPFCVLVSVAAICGCSSDAPAPVTPNPFAVTPGSSSPGAPSTANNAPSTAQNPATTAAPSTAAAPTQPDITKRLADQQRQDTLRAVFRSAWNVARPGDPNGRLRQELQPIRDSIPRITVSTKPKACKWNHLKMNQLGMYFDAVRFHTPPGARNDLVLAFCCGGAIPNWSVLGLSQTARPVGDSEVEWNVKVKGVKLPDDNLLILQADPLELEPDTDYVLWINFGNAEVRDVHLAVALLAHDPARADLEAAEIASLVGFEYQGPKFTASAAGVKEALQFAKSLWNRGAAGSPKFNEALLSVARSLPEANVGQDGKMAWNKIQTNNSGIGFDAYHFRSPLSGPADLHYVLGKPRNQDLGYGVASRDGFNRGGTFGLEVDLQLPNVVLPPQNVTFFELLPFGQILPGQEYVFWIDTTGEGQIPTSLGLHLSPPSPFPKLATSSTLASAAGISLPKKIEPSRFEATRRKCREWCFERGIFENHVLRKGLQSVASNLATVEVTSGNKALSWNTVRLNADGVGFDAVRFKSPLDVPAEVYCLFGDSRGLKWQLISAEGNEARIDNIHRASAAAFEEIPAPMTSEITLASDSWKNGAPVTMEPGREYILWFASPDGASPRDLQLAVHFLPREKEIGFQNAAEIAARVGLAVAAGSPRAGNQLVGKHEKAVIDVAFSPDGRSLASLDSTGVVKFWNLNDRKPTATFTKKGNRFGRCVKYFPDGKKVAIGLNEPDEIVIWDVEARKVSSKIPVGPMFLMDLAISPDGTRIAVSRSGTGGPRDSTASIAVLNLQSKAKSIEKPLEGLRFKRLEWPTEDRLLAIGYKPRKVEGAAVYTDAAVAAWDPRTLTYVTEALEQLQGFDDLAVSASTGLVVALGSPRTLKLCKLPNLESLPPLALFGMPGSPTVAPGRVALSPDGRYAALCNMGWDLQYWDLAERRLLFMRRAHEGEIGRIAIARDGKTIVTCGQDLTVQQWDPQFPASTAIENSLGMKFARIPAGTFTMGSPQKEQGRNPQQEGEHPVSISQDFLMGMHEVTRGQFRQFVEATGYKTTAETNGSGGSHMYPGKKDFESRPELNWRTPAFPQDDNHPVVQVSYIDAVAFCKWLSAKEGERYRLPTEAEWEYACRAGTKGEYFFNDTAYYLPVIANFADRSIVQAYGQYPGGSPNQDDHFAYTSPVGSYAANGFGLYDMAGNAWEWCADWFDAAYYANSPQQDPTGPTSGKNRVQRGGGYNAAYWQCRSAYRDLGSPDQVQSVLGFRVVREIR